MKKFFLLYLLYLFCANFAHGQIQRIKLYDHIILGTSIFEGKAAINTFQKEALLYGKTGKDFVFFKTIPKDNIDFVRRSLLPMYNQEIIIPDHLTPYETGIITHKLKVIINLLNIFETMEGRVQRLTLCRQDSMNSLYRMHWAVSLNTIF